MKVPTLHGVIDRRILVNYRIEPTALHAILPPVFRPKLVGGYAIGGICLIRLKHIRPAWLKVPFGISSENAAHRFAVEWDTPDGPREGVYIPRRDTNSSLNARAGGRLFPGMHHHARFIVNESDDHYEVAFTSDDGKASVTVQASVGDMLSATSIFGSLQEASTFFERGSLGYSASSRSNHFDGLELDCRGWHVQPLHVTTARSRYFDDPTAFPPGSVTLDHALLMRGIEHQWRAHGPLCCNTSG